MAEPVKEDEYKKLRDAFHTKLLQFHQANNNPIRRFPLLGGKELDMYHLYNKVKSLGGSKRITQDRLWGEVARSFNLPPSVTSASYACRQNFIKYLEAFEKYELGEPINYKSNDPPSRQVVVQNTPTSSLQSPASSLNTPTTLNASSPLAKNNLIQLLSMVPGFNNLLKQLSKTPSLLSQISAMPSLLQLPANQLQLVQLLLQQLTNLQQSNQLVATAHGMARFDWLVRSLQSGFPNEVDLAINSLIMLSNDSEKVFVISNKPHLLSVLLAHVGIFWEEDPGLESLYLEWHKNNEQDFFAFWQEIVPEWVYLPVLPHHLLYKDHHIFECFPNKSVCSHECIESFRLAQVLLIVRNLSFKETNVQYLSKHEAIVRLLFLSINCSLPQVKSFALETLVNISPYLVIHTEYEHVTYLILVSVYDCILSSDKHAILSGMEILSGFAWCLQNESSLSMIHDDVIKRMFQLLLVPDYQILQTCLDALYNLSFYGGRIVEMILSTEYCISILTRLITVKVEDLDTWSLRNLLLIHPSGKTEPLLENVSATNQNPAAAEKHTTSQSESNSVSSTSAGHTPSGRPSTKPPVKLNNRFDRNVGVVATASTMTNQTEVWEIKSKFATNWLNLEYAISQEEFIPKQDIYNRYLLYCSQAKHTNAATQIEFDQILRKVFPHIITTTVKLLGKDTEFVAGIGTKKTPITTVIPSLSLQTTPKTRVVSATATCTTNLKTASSNSPSPPPSQPLSPLQQLLQATKSQNTMKTNSQNTPSPLLHSKRVGSTGLRLKRPPPIINNFSTASPTILAASKQLGHDVSRAHSEESSTSLSLKQDYAKMNGDSRLMVGGVINKFGKRQISSEDGSEISSSAKRYKTNNINSSEHQIYNNYIDKRSSSVNSDTVKANTEQSIDLISRSGTPSTTDMISVNSYRSVSPVSAQLLRPTGNDRQHSLSPGVSLTTVVDSKFICLWENCLLVKSDYTDLFSHIYYDHVPQITTFPSSCLWANCSSKSKRMKPSLLQHIRTYHCSSDPIPVPLNVTDTLLKLRLVSLWENEQESCITKSLRLTSTLILRNLLDKSPQARSQLQPYEPLLAQIALSNNEASNVASQCVYLLSSVKLSSSPS